MSKILRQRYSFAEERPLDSALYVDHGSGMHACVCPMSGSNADSDCTMRCPMFELTHAGFIKDGVQMRKQIVVLHCTPRARAIVIEGTEEAVDTQPKA